MSESLITGIDIEQGIFAEDGMKMLEEYESGGFDSFFNDFSKSNKEKAFVSVVSNSPEEVKTLKKDSSTGKYF